VLTETHRTAAPSFAGSGYEAHAVPAPSAHAGGIIFLTRGDAVGADFAQALRPTLPMPAFGGDEEATDTTTQWATLHMSPLGLARPIWLIGAYIQPGSHAITVPRLAAQLRRLDTALQADTATHRPYVLLCGDFNLHDPALGVDADPPPDEQDWLQRIEDAHFACASRALAWGEKTHMHGGVLDLFFEREEPGVETLIECITVDNGSQEGTPLVRSDHFPVIATLVDPATAPPRPLAAKETTWDTDAATPEQQRTFTAEVSGLTAIGAAYRSTQDRRASLADALSDRLSDLDGFQLTLVEALDAQHTHAAPRYKQRACAAATAALGALLAVLHFAAQEHLKPRACNRASEPCYPPQLQATRRAMLRCERLHRAAPHSTAAADTAHAANLVFRHALQEHQRERWDAIKAAVEEEGEGGRHKVLWSAFKRVRKWRDSTPPIGAGLLTAAGTLTATPQESAEALAAYFRAQCSPHATLTEGAVRTPPVEPRAPTEIDALDDALAEMQECIERDSNDEDTRLADDLVAMREALCDAPPTGVPLYALLQRDRLVSDEALRKLLAESNIHTAAGPDRLNGHLLRWTAESPSAVCCLALLVNFCHAFRVLPQQWRDAHMLPLHKKGKPRRECGSYRPISLTSLLMRRIERLMEERVRDLIDTRLSRWQAGFRRRRSTRQQITMLLHRIQRGIARTARHRDSVPYPVVFLDISRAFDSVPHEMLLLKLWRAGLRGADLQYFQAFVSGRRFRIMAHDCLGEWTAVLAGVPQGAVLSPPLYALFINDATPDAPLSVAFISDIGSLLYADDMTIAPPSDDHSVVHYHRALQRSLDYLGDWARRWGVRFSAAKSGCVWFRRGAHLSYDEERALAHAHTLPPLRIPYNAQLDVEVPYVAKYQYLGVWLDEKLSARAHVAHLLDTCGTVSALLRSIQTRDGPPGFAVISTLVRTVLLPRITYGLPFIAPTPAEYARLNALLFRPLLGVLALPRNVHRAGLAVYTGQPVLEVVREHALLKLIASTLRQIADPIVRARPYTYPVFSTVWAHCNRRAVRLQHVRVQIAPSAAARNAIMREAPLFTEFAAVAHRWGVVAHLPGDESAPYPRAVEDALPAGGTMPWNRHALSRSIDAAALRLMRYRWLLETRGYALTHGVLNEGLPAADHPTVTPRGEQLPILFGVPAAATDVKALEAAAATLTDDSSTWAEAAAPSLALDTHTHAKARARVALRRTALRFDRHHRDRRASPTASHCRRCPGLPETARHAILECPRRAERRTELCAQLRTAMATVRAHVGHNGRMAQILCNEAEALYHIIVASPVALQCIPSCEEHARLARITGMFLMHLPGVWSEG
jgi:hypothetical protein